MLRMKLIRKQKTEAQVASTFSLICIFKYANKENKRKRE